MEAASVLGLGANVVSAIALLKDIYEAWGDAPEGLAIVTTQATVFERELDRLKSYQLGLPKDRRLDLEKDINNEECRDTINHLKDFVSKIKPSWEKFLSMSESEQAKERMKWKEKVKWFWKMDEAKKLAGKLSRQADRVWKCTLATMQEHVLVVEGNTGLIMDKLTQIILRFEVAGATEDIDGVLSLTSTEAITWHGQFRCKPDQGNHEKYFRDREKLANATYSGDWVKVFDLLGHGSSQHPNLINCWRTCHSTEMDKVPSGYTALHQAAWHGAPKDVAERLLQRGAWRLARTLRHGSSPKYSTPLDVARDHGWTHLYDILKPTTRRPLHYKVLRDLQTRLHDLIQESFEQHPKAHLECFILPELEILTEYEHARIWFSLQPELQDTRDGLAVQIILERQELVMILRWGREKRKLYRISRWKTKEINHALLLRS